MWPLFRRTELHLNHLAENNVFGIVPLAKVRGLQDCQQLWALGYRSLDLPGVLPENSRSS